MKLICLPAAFAALLVLGCASSDTNSSSGPNIGVHISGTDLTRDILYMGGPVAVRFQMTVTNPTNQPLKLRSLELRTIGPASFILSSGTTTVNQAVPAGGTRTFQISAWGRSSGGYIASDEPIQMRGVAVFEGPDRKPFPRVFTDTLISQ